MSLMELIAISGIFGKSSDLDILPPPPPFPDIGIGKKPNDAAEEVWKRGKEGRKGKRLKLEKQEKDWIKKEAGAKIPQLIRSVEKNKIEFEEKDFDDIKEDEDEIKKAIDGMKEKSRAPTINMLFKRKEKSKKESLISDVTDAEKIETPEVMPRTFDKIDHVQEIEERVHKARMRLMDFKFDDAKRIYMEIMRLYSSISQKDRHKVYQDIKDLYYERKSAEKFAKI